MARPVHPAVPSSIAEWNEAHNPEHDPYNTTGRMCVSRNGYSREEWPKERLVAMLRTAADLIDSHGDDADVMADVHCFLDNAQRVLPAVPCWTIVKHYAFPTGFGPSVWVGCLDEQQARDLAPAIEAHYARDGRPPDRFVVERGHTHPVNVVAPGTTVDAYLERLR